MQDETVTPQTTDALWAHAQDRALAGVFEAREADWRNGAMVYQVLVDRFVPSADLAAKRHLYPAPKQLREWSDVPRSGRYLEDQRLWSHEIDFWGGDLASLRSKLDYVKALGADVLYLNPICLATTNHKYDALDYNTVSPEYGSRADVVQLAQAVHAQGMKLVLDGVFNHMGRQAPAFQTAMSSADSPHRDWFFIGPQYPGGARAWAQAQNLPELNLENPAVRRLLWEAPDSVVQSYLKDGVDGWRLDVAFDIGFRHLQALTDAAHAQKPGSLVVGEIWNYPNQWFPSVDGIMNFTLREIVLRLARGQLAPEAANQMIERVVQDAGIEPLLKSWLMLDNHDTPRLATALPQWPQRQLAQLLQFTLPGAPNLYYGSELGMEGGDDPEMRAPMRWDLVGDHNASLRWTRQLIKLRQQHRALRVGNHRRIDAAKLLAFERYTDRAADTVLVLVNPSASAVKDTVMVANSKLMNGTAWRNLLAPGQATPRLVAGLVDVELPPFGMLVLAPQVEPVNGYTPYKRVQ